MNFPEAVGPILGDATLIIQDYADSPNPPPPRELKVKVTRIEQNDDGSFTMPDGSIHWPEPK